MAWRFHEHILAREMGWTWLEEARDAQERGELSAPAEDDALAIIARLRSAR